MKLPFIIIILTMLSCKMPEIISANQSKSVSLNNFMYKFNDQIEDELNKESEDWKYQVAAMDYSSIGEYKKSLASFDTDEKEKKALDKEVIENFKTNFKPKNAKDFILSKAKKKDILIINEAHHQPQHRVFAIQLLKGLYDRGYRQLGIEAFLPSNDSMSVRKYPYIEDVLYYDPQFGELIRTASEIGFQVFPYDYNPKGVDDDSNKGREIIAAKNIHKEMKKNPKDKFLIYCGYAHAAEGNYGGSFEKMLAARLTEFTGKDPLTINQVVFTERSEDKYNDPIYNEIKIDEPTVFVDSLSNSYQKEYNNYWFDIFVFHPRTQYVNGRPNWLFTDGKKPRKIDLTKVNIDFPCLVLAFNKGEDIQKAIPVDVVEANNKDSNIYLALKKGEYSIVIQNKNREGRLIHISF